LPDEANSYLTAALARLEALKAIDVWLSFSSDVRLAWVTVATTFNLTSTRVMALVEIAEQLGVRESTLTRSKAKFAELIGLDAGDGIGSVRRIPNRTVNQVDGL
jgi:hypothetical protein